MKPSTAGILVGLPLLSACDLPGQAPAIQDGGTLTVAITGDPTSLNRFLAADSASLRASAPLFPNLYQANPDMSISPDLAASMPSLSDDRKSWTVRLRQNARWSDGQPITADDVLATVAIQRNPALVTDVVFDWSVLAKVSKVDAYTVRFDLTSPYAPFLANSLPSLGGRSGSRSAARTKSTWWPTPTTMPGAPTSTAWFSRSCPPPPPLPMPWPMATSAGSLTSRCRRWTNSKAVRASKSWSTRI